MYRYVWDREHLQSPPWQSRHVVQSRLSPESVGWSEGVMCKGESLEAAPAHRKSKVIHSNHVINKKVSCDIQHIQPNSI